MSASSPARATAGAPGWPPRCSRAVDDAQVLDAAALHGWLDQPPCPSGDEVHGLHDHAFGPASGELLPPGSCCGLAGGAGQVDLTGRRGHHQAGTQGPGGLGELGCPGHVPVMAPVGMDVALAAMHLCTRMIHDKMRSGEELTEGEAVTAAELLTAMKEAASLVGIDLDDDLEE